MKHYALFINGQSVPAASGRTFQTLNPADHREIVGEYALGGSEDAVAAIQAATAAFPHLGVTGSVALARRRKRMGAGRMRTKMKTT